MYVADKNQRQLYSRLLKAGGLVDGSVLLKGETAPQSYVLNEPVLFINTQNSAPIVDKINYVVCTYTIINERGYGATLFSQTGRIRGRGNSTWTMPKKPYKVKLDNSVSVLGMPKSKDWALLANYIDPSHLRNCVASEISNRTGLAWAPRIQNMEVYLNGNYQGLYMWSESVVVDKNRVNIDDIKTSTTGNALTGGYIMEIDTRLEQDNETGWRTRLNVPVIFDTPDGTVSQQFTYIKTFIQGCEDALFAENFATAGDWRNTWFDMNSWADWYLVNELIANNDSGFGSSVKLTKPRDPTTGPPSKLYLGPIWDSDASCGITFFIPHPTNTWWTRVGATWIARMLEDPAFQAVVRARWALLRSRLLAQNDTIFDWISKQQAAITSALTRDAQLWGNGSAPDLSTWLTARISWIESQLIQGLIDTTPPSVPTGFATSSIAATSVTFSWDDAGAANGTGVVGYRIRKNGVIAAITAYPYSIPVNQATVSGLTTATQYAFTLECRDPAGNWSAATTTLNVTTN